MTLPPRPSTHSLSLSYSRKKHLLKVTALAADQLKSAGGGPHLSSIGYKNQRIPEMWLIGKTKEQKEIHAMQWLLIKMTKLAEPPNSMLYHPRRP